MMISIFSVQRALRVMHPPLHMWICVVRRFFRRVLIKEVLRQAFTETGISSSLELTDNVHGEFGNVADWNSYRNQVDHLVTGHFQ
jgi:hypothetical protein